MLTSSSLQGEEYTAHGSDEDYAKQLFMSRSAKVKRWCGLQAHDIEDKLSHRTGHRRTTSSTGSIPNQHRPATLEQHRTPQDDFHMPMILVTEPRSNNHDMVNNVPWVDWLEEYKVVKASEMRRRSSTQKDVEVPPQDNSMVNRVLSHWWQTVKTGAENCSKSKQDVPTSKEATIPNESPIISTPLSHPKNALNLSLDLHDFQHPLEGKSKDTPSSRRWSATQNMDTDSVSPMSLHSNLSSVLPEESPSQKPNQNPITQKSLAKRVGYRFFNPGNRMGTLGQLSHIFGNRSTTEDADLNSTQRIQHSIKSRLQFAKEACDVELRHIIDGLNEYVERGLQYVEDVDEILEEGIRSVGSVDTEEEEEEPFPTLASVVEIDETPSPPPSSTNSLPHKRSLAIALEEEEEAVRPPPVALIIPEDQPHSMVALISEDAYLPTPFILTLQDLITVAQHVMDTSLDAIIETDGACAEAVSKIQAIGSRWDEHPEWPCREWYVRLLLGIAALNRVVEWWAAERGFWSSNQALTSVPPSDTEGDDMDIMSSRMDETDTEHMSIDETPKDNVSIMSHDTHSEHFDMEQPFKSTQLQEEAEKSQNSTIIVELSLGTTAVQYVSPVWFDVVG